MLEEYKKKRDFEQTPEPAAMQPRDEGGALSFVIQKHSARNLHYDFRIELDGVLKSWAVPKGPSLDPGQKRLAMMVEDHPLDYGSFEGVIPKGNYGAGEVIVWDNGTFAPDEDGPPPLHDREEAQRQLRNGLEKGKLSLFLRGKKLTGSWTLIRTSDEKNEWLFFKHRDKSKGPFEDVLNRDESVLSGLTIEDLKKGLLPEHVKKKPTRALSELAGAKKAAFPESASPMLATLADAPFNGEGWTFEPKLDGVRTIALISHGAVKLLSRRGLDVSRQYPSIAAELLLQSPAELVLDGEIITFDEQGKPSFQRLQQRLNLTKDAEIRLAEARIPVLYFVFDILHLDGFDLKQMPLDERKRVLEEVLLVSERIQLVQGFAEQGEATYRAAVAHGFEGVIAKRTNSPYEAGKRSQCWLKVKATLSDDFVVGGFTAGLGARKGTFGALVVGYRSDKGELVYAGNVGSGFDDRLLQDLRNQLDALRTGECPFTPRPPVKDVTWVRPEMVIEAKFAQWTEVRNLRAPVFLRVRTDVAPEEKGVPTITHAPKASRSDAAPKTRGSAADVVGQLREARPAKAILNVQGHEIHVTNLDKVFWPAHGERSALTKRDFLIYLAQVSEHTIRHLKDRPLTLVRFPNGALGERFYQKHWKDPLPEFVETVRLYSEHADEDQEYLLGNNLPTLLWLGQLADLELHAWLSRVEPAPEALSLSQHYTGSKDNLSASLLNYPDFLLFDLDPYIYSGKESAGDEPELNRDAFTKACDLAISLKELLDSLSLKAFIKTSGRTGLHIFVPIERQYTFDVVRSLSETLGVVLLKKHSRDLTMDWAVPKRTGKIFLDVNQNVRGKTMSWVYSPRASIEASVSTPISWDEVGKVYPTEFTMATVPARLEKVGDLWADVLSEKNDLKRLVEG